MSKIWQEPVRGGYADVRFLGLDGAERMRVASKGTMPAPPIHHLTGLRPVEGDVGTAVYEMPGLISGCLLVFSLSISAFVTPALMGNPRERMVGQQIYDEVLVSFNWPSASSLALTLVLLTVGLMFCALFASRHAGRQETAR